MKIRNTIYFDHQATTPVDPRVLVEMIPYLAICSVIRTHRITASVGNLRAQSRMLRHESRG